VNKSHFKNLLPVEKMKASTPYFPPVLAFNKPASHFETYSGGHERSDF